MKDNMNNEELYNFLIKIDVLPKEDLERLLLESKNKNISLEDLIFSENIFSEPELLKIKSILSGLPKAGLDKKAVSFGSLSNIPENISREFGAVCFLENSDGLHIACYNTKTPDSILSYLPKEKKKNFYLDTSKNIKKVLLDYQKSSSEEFGFRISNLSKKVKKLSSYGTKDFTEFFPEDYLLEIANDIYTERIIGLIIEDAINQESNSVYITGEHNKTVIKYRIGSKNINTAILDQDISLPILLNIKSRSNLDVTKDHPFENGYFILKNKKGERVFVTVNILKTFSGYRVAMSLSKNEDDVVETIESMIQSPIQIENIYKKISEGRGFFVLSGNSKTGKTRAYYNIIKLLQKKNLDIISIEKTPELRIFGISQLVSGESTSFFSKLLEKGIQQNPDVLALSNLYKSDVTKLLNQSSFGKLILSEYTGRFSRLFSDLKKLSFSNETLDRVVSASICHETFNSYKNLEKINLNKKEVSTLNKILPEGEILELLKYSGVIDKRLSKLIDVSFYAKTRKSKKLHEEIYVRGVLDVKESVSFEKDSTKDVERKTKIAILENALILSVLGKIDIKEVLDFIK
jgi:type II secretory ATPase GspE/PulE/Tfp pilus assembly ATPase PilB-like protein